MPHKCAHCEQILADGSPEILTGCECGSRVFLYLRKDYRPTEKETIEVLEEKKFDKKELEGISQVSEKIDEGEIITLDVENIIQLDSGSYLLDLHSLLKGDPVVIKEKGVYFIDIQHAMKKPKR